MIDELKCHLTLDEVQTDQKTFKSTFITGSDSYGNEDGVSNNCSESNTKKLVEENKNQQENHKTNDYSLVQCEFCGKRYKTYERLKSHFRFCHAKVYHKCNICSQQFSKKCLLNTHMRKHTGESPYNCLYCNEKFISNIKLQIHSNFHHKEKNLFCNICNVFGFYTKQDLGNHIRTKHTKERIFHCEVCDKSFMSSSVYYQHRLIHTNIRKYSCNVCGRAFRRWLTLHNHLRIHTNERPFLCDVCKQAFRQKGDMKKHRMNQHSNVKT